MGLDNIAAANLSHNSPPFCLASGPYSLQGKRAWARGAYFNTAYVLFFTKYEKYVVKTISFDNVIDKLPSIRAGKVPL
jgi:hypothetical protein